MRVESFILQRCSAESRTRSSVADHRVHFVRPAMPEHSRGRLCHTSFALQRAEPESGQPRAIDHGATKKPAPPGAGFPCLVPWITPTDVLLGRAVGQTAPGVFSSSAGPPPCCHQSIRRFRIDSFPGPHSFRIRRSSSRLSASLLRASAEERLSISESRNVMVLQPLANE